MQTCFSIAIAVMLMIGHTPLLTAQSESGQIVGRIVTPPGRPPCARCVVELTDMAGRSSTILADLSGHFSLRNLRNEEYFLRVAADGYQPFSQMVVVHEGIMNLVIELEPVAMKRNDYKPQVVDVSPFRPTQPKAAVHDELEPLIELSTLYLIRGEFTAAMQASVDAFNRDRQSARALFNLGAALYCSSMFDLARGALLRAISIDARATQARLLVIRMLLQQRNWDEALQHVELYLKENRRGAEREAVLKVRTELQRRNRVPPSELTLDFPVRLGPVVRTNVCGN